MTITIHLDFASEKELAAFLDDCLMNQTGLQVNGVDLTGVYSQIVIQIAGAAP